MLMTTIAITMDSNCKYDSRVSLKFAKILFSHEIQPSARRVHQWELLELDYAKQESTIMAIHREISKLTKCLG